MFPARPFRPLELLRTFGPFGPVRPVVALRAIRTGLVAIAVAPGRRTLLLATLRIVHLAVGSDRIFIPIVFFIVTIATLILFFETRAAIFEHAEIMIRELKVIFGLDAVAGELHVARQCLILFEQLGGVTALAIVLAIAIRTAGNTLGTLSAAAPTAAALTIIDQVSCSLSHRTPPCSKRPLIFQLAEAMVPSR